MRFAAYAEGIIAANVKGMAIERCIAEGFFMAANGFLRDFGEPDAADPRRGSAEIAIDEIVSRLRKRFPTPNPSEIRGVINLLEKPKP